MVNASGSYDPAVGTNEHMLASTELIDADGVVLWAASDTATRALTVPARVLSPGVYTVATIVTSTKASDARTAATNSTLTVLEPAQHPHVPLLRVVPGLYMDPAHFVVSADLVLQVDVVDSARCGSWRYEWTAALTADAETAEFSVANALTNTSGSVREHAPLQHQCIMSNRAKLAYGSITRSERANDDFVARAGG